MSASFQVISNSSPTYQPTIRSYIVCDTECVVKNWKKNFFFLLRWIILFYFPAVFHPIFNKWNAGENYLFVETKSEGALKVTKTLHVIIEQQDLYESK
jgi:hypothetical protein